MILYRVPDDSTSGIRTKKKEKGTSAETFSFALPIKGYSVVVIIITFPAENFQKIRIKNKKKRGPISRPSNMCHRLRLIRFDARVAHGAVLVPKAKHGNSLPVVCFAII